MMMNLYFQNASHCKLHPILGSIYMSCIYHAMTERFFGTSCIYHTTTELPNPRFQNTPHVAFHAMTERFFGASSIYHTTTELPNPRFQNTPHMAFHICYAPRISASHYYIIQWNFFLIPKGRRDSGFLKKRYHKSNQRLKTKNHTNYFNLDD